MVSSENFLTSHYDTLPSLGVSRDELTAISSVYDELCVLDGREVSNGLGPIIVSSSNDDTDKSMVVVREVKMNVASKGVFLSLDVRRQSRRLPPIMEKYRIAWDSNGLIIDSLSRFSVNSVEGSDPVDDTSTQSFMGRSIWLDHIADFGSITNYRLALVAEELGEMLKSLQV